MVDATSASEALSSRRLHEPLLELADISEIVPR
jgi:hypothetical protein